MDAAVYISGQRLQYVTIAQSPAKVQPCEIREVAEHVGYVGVGLWTTRGYCIVLRLRDVEDAVPYYLVQPKYDVSF